MAETSREQDRVRNALRVLAADVRRIAESPPTGTEAVQPRLAFAEELAGVRDGLRAAWQEGLASRRPIYAARCESVRAVLAKRENRLRAYAERQRVAVPPAEGKFIVAGRVTDRATGVGLANVRVHAFDMDRRHDERLGHARTDALGYFRIEYAAEDLADDPDRKAEAYLEVLDEKGETIFTSPKSFVRKSEKAEFISVQVDGDKAPNALAVGKKISQSVSHQLQRLDRRARELTRWAEALPEAISAPATATARPRPGTPPKPSDSDTGAEKVAERKPAESSPAAPGQPPIPVTEVNGIGQVFAKRLKTRRITDVRGLARLTPVQLAKTLDIGEERAEKILVEANQLLKRRGETGTK